MLSRVPPMGFNTWNTFGPDIDESVILQTADKMVELGLRDAGYEYLVIDDCWSERERDPVSGKIVPDHVKFPHGMKYVSDYVHSKGLKFGMYSCAGVRTCADYPGSFDHEYLDAVTFAEYGADFLKYDFCYHPDSSNGPLLYRRMALALRNCGRDILYSACNWGSDDVNKWIRSAGAHMYRSTGDINDSFVSFRDIFLSQINNFAYSSPACFNDIDMLTVGMYGSGNVGATGCTDIEYRTQFALWCMYSAPLMIGCDIRKINDYCLDLLKNRHLIRINQDKEGRPPFIVAQHSGGRVFCSVKIMSDNEYAILMVNLDDSDHRMYFCLEDVGIPAATGKTLELTDVFSDNGTIRCGEIYADQLAAHDCRVFIAKIV